MKILKNEVSFQVKTTISFDFLFSSLSIFWKIPFKIQDNVAAHLLNLENSVDNMWLMLVLAIILVILILICIICLVYKGRCHNSENGDYDVQRRV